jgi:geranylgeranyl diphosphate synthase type II
LSVDVDVYLSERALIVEAELDAVLPQASTAPRDLHAAMRHLVFPGGKRFRPVLAMAAAEAMGGEPKDALPVAVAVELVHQYSLIHDDLPCMDDDAERRGRPTVHIAYGEAVAVLAGDALQSLAFEVLAEAAGNRPSNLVALAVRDLARAIGSRELVGGQADDLVYDPENTDVAAIESVHARKTGALIACAVAGGARLAGASGKQVEELRMFGVEVGVAFQIADDLFDEDDDDVCSLVRALGPKGSRDRAEALLASALARVEEFGEPAEPLRQLARFAVQRKG